jgi:O-antigen ligase
MGKIGLLPLCAYVAIIPYENLGYFEDVPSAAKLFGAVIVVAGILAFLFGHRPRMIPRALVVRSAIVLFGMLSLAWSLDPDATRTHLPRVAQFLIFGFMIWEFAVSVEDQLWLMRSFLIGMVVLLTMAALQFHGASHLEVESGERFTGGASDANYMAHLCSIAILFSVYLATSQSSWDRYLRWCYWGFAFWCALQALLTGSRGGLISLLAAGLFAMVLGGVSRRRIITVVQVAAIALLVFVVARQVVSTELLNRLTFSGGGGTSIDDDPRMRIWKHGLETYWRNNILLGIGDGAFDTVMAEGDRKYAAHSLYICVLVELGIIGATLYLLYLFLLFRAAWRLPHREKLLWIGVVTITLLEGLTLSAYNDKVTWFVYMMLLAQSASLGQMSRKPRPQRRLSGVVPLTVGPLRPGLRKS